MPCNSYYSNLDPSALKGFLFLLPTVSLCFISSPPVHPLFLHDDVPPAYRSPVTYHQPPLSSVVQRSHSQRRRIEWVSRSSYQGHVFRVAHILILSIQLSPQVHSLSTLLLHLLRSFVPSFPRCIRPRAPPFRESSNIMLRVGGWLGGKSKHGHTKSLSALDELNESGFLFAVACLPV